LSLLHTNRGAEYGAKEDYDRAIADHDQAIKIDPKNALAYNNRGIMKLKKGDQEGGNADLARARELQPGIAQPPQTTQAVTPSTNY
jgi:Flp pilus assembly protein TadD